MKNFVENLLVTDKSGNILSYAFFKSNYDKKEKLYSMKKFDETVLFKSVADHRTFAVLVQNIISFNENESLRASKTDKEKKILELTEAGKDAHVDELEKLENELFDINMKLSVLEPFYADVKEAIPDKYKDIKLYEYPMQVIILANNLQNITPDYPVDCIESACQRVRAELIEKGSTDKLSETALKDVQKLLKDHYSPLYSTTKDIVFKRWTLKFDLQSIRELLTACMNKEDKVSGLYSYRIANKKELQKSVQHALLRRLQVSNADTDRKEPKQDKQEKGGANNE